MVSAAGGHVEAVEVTGGGGAGGRDGREMDENIGVGDGLLGEGGIAQIADEVVLGRGAVGEGNGVHGANLVRAFPVGGECLAQPPGAAGDRYTHRTSLQMVDWLTSGTRRRLSGRYGWGYSRSTMVTAARM